MNTPSSTDDTAHEFQPFETIFLARRDEIVRLVHVSAYSMHSMHGAARLSEMLKHDSESVQRAREMEDAALAEVASDFPHLHSAGTVLIWGALEAAVRDFLARWLVKHPDLLLLQELRRVRVPVGEYEPLGKDDRMRFVVAALERELAAGFKPGPGRFECLLHPVKVVPKIPDDIRRDICELAAIRNVIVHCASIADGRLLELCPWITLKVGDPLRITGVAFRRYVAAASEFAAATIVSAQHFNRSVVTAT